MIQVTIIEAELRASFWSEGGEKVAVQLAATPGGLTLAIASPGFDRGRYLTPEDMLAVGEAIKSLATHLKNGGQEL